MRYFVSKVVKTTWSGTQYTEYISGRAKCSRQYRRLVRFYKGGRVMNTRLDSERNGGCGAC